MSGTAGGAHHSGHPSYHSTNSPRAGQGHTPRKNGPGSVVASGYPPGYFSHASQDGEEQVEEEKVNPIVAALLSVVRASPELQPWLNGGKDVVSHVKLDSSKKMTRASAEKTKTKSSKKPAVDTVEALENAWMCLLRIFRQFDPSETNYCSPRQFCLAISVLLSDDIVVFSQDDWKEVVGYYAMPLPKKSSSTSSVSAVMSAVDYMAFCDMVVTPSDAYIAFFAKQRSKRTSK